MKTILSLAIIFFLPVFLFAQTARGAKEAFMVCDDHVFTSVEVLPGFKNGEAAFEDSLAAYLKKKGVFPKSGGITFSFIVTKQSVVMDIHKGEGDVRYEKQVQEALLSIPDLWIPAKQNTYTVCAYVDLHLEFSKDKVAAKILSYKEYP